MFKFLKEKLKSAISKISEGVEKEGKVEENIAEKPAEEEKGFFAKLKEKFARSEEKEEAREAEEPKEVLESKEELVESKEAKTEPAAEPEEEKETEKGFFESLKEKIITTKINEEQFDKLFWELELALLENNVAVEAIEKIKSDLKAALVEKPIKRSNIEQTIENALKDSIQGLFVNSDFNLLGEIRKKQDKPYVIVFFGINGSGKTTSIAKVAKMLKDSKLSCVLAAADTFRAASIEQLELHGNRIGVKVIKHDYGSDPAAVAFDAIKHAKAKNADAVLIDTAGRMHSNKNLMKEMEKVVRVAKPDLRIFVGESITGNDAVEQAKAFNDSLGIDGIILSKLDVDEKGGAAVSVSYVTQKPILYFGNGQEYKDLKKFEAEVVVRGLGLE